MDWVLLIDIESKLCLQASIVHRFAFNRDEINDLALSYNGSYLAAADDSGELKIIDLRTQELHKTLRSVHDNICAAVAYRPHHPWEVLSGGLDSKLVRWNLATGRPLRSWNITTEEVDRSTAQVRRLTTTVFSAVCYVRSLIACFCTLGSHSASLGFEKFWSLVVKG
jgi:WD40 repeat protein